MGHNLSKMYVGNIAGTIHDTFSMVSKCSRFGSTDIFDNACPEGTCQIAYTDLGWD